MEFTVYDYPRYYSEKEVCFLPKSLEVDVKDNVEIALKQLKKKMVFEGVFREVKKRRYYEKPSAKRKRKKEESLRRIKKRRKRFEQNLRRNKRYRKF